MKSLTDQFADWVATKPADEAYNYIAASKCAVTQFAREMGYSHLVDQSKLYGGVIPFEMYTAVNFGGPEDWTFGALSHRLGEVNQSRRGS